MTLAMLGTGMIGGGLAAAWLARGEAASVWNRSPEKAAALGAKGARVAASAADATRGAREVHLALSDDAAVDAVLDEVLAAGALSEGALVIDHTTTSTHGTRARAERLAARGVAFLHAPVFMSPQMAEERKGMMLLCGPAALRERARPSLAAMTGEVLDLGDRPDAAAAFKLFGNIMIITMTAGIADVLTLATANGFAGEEALSLFSKFNVAGIFGARGARMAKGDYEPASFELTMAKKDVRLMIESAPDATFALLPAIRSRMGELIERGLGSADLGALAADAVPPRR